MTDGILRFIPGVRVARTYDRSWLTSDVVAGLVLTAILIPVGMGYAQAAGLPAIAGLYATIIPLLLYAVFGPSRILVLGPDSSLAAIIAATVAPLALGDPERATSLAAALALISGAFCIAFGVLRLGLLTELLSKPIRIGYLNGIALTVFIGQLPKLFGFSVDTDGVTVSAAPSSSAWHRRGHRPGGTRGRAGRDRGHPRLSTMASGHPGRPHRGGRRNRDRGTPRARGVGRRPGRRAAAAGAADVRDPGCLDRGRGGDGGGRTRHRGRIDGRHERPVADPCGPRRREGGPEPGAARAWRGERRRRSVPRVLDQRQRIADAGRRAGGSEDPARRRGRRPDDRRAPRRRPGPDDEPATGRPGRRSS